MNKMWKRFPYEKTSVWRYWRQQRKGREREEKSFWLRCFKLDSRVFSFPFFAFRSSVRSGLSAYLGMNLLFFSQNKSSSTMVRRTMLPQLPCTFSLYHTISSPTIYTLSLFCLADYLSFRYSFLSSSVHFMKRNISAFGTLRKNLHTENKTCCYIQHSTK